MAQTPIKSIADVPALQASRPDLKLATPVIAVGHPNEAKFVAHVNLALQALTPAQSADAIAEANFVGSVKTWRP
jgi:hypothetical protein